MNQRAVLVTVGSLIVLTGIAAGSWLLTRTVASDDRAVSPAPAKLAVQPTSQPRTVEQIRAEMGPISSQITAMGGKKLLTAAGRETVDRDTLIPLLHQQLELGRELAQVAPQAEVADKALFALLILGDPEAAAMVNVEAAASTPAAAYAQSVRSMADYVVNESNADRQILAIDQFFETLKAAADDAKLTSRLSIFAEATPASPDVIEHLVQQINAAVPEPRRSTVIGRLKKTPSTNPT